MNKLLARILHSGLYDTSEESHFSWSRCPVCNGLAGDRYDVTGYPDLEHARAKDGIEFEACPKCIYEAEYGEGSYE